MNTKNFILCHVYFCIHFFNGYPAETYLLKISSGNTKTKCESYSKLSMQAPEWRQWLLEKFTWYICIYIYIYIYIYICIYNILTYTLFNYLKRQIKLTGNTIGQENNIIGKNIFSLYLLIKTHLNKFIKSIYNIYSIYLYDICMINIYIYIYIIYRYNICIQWL